MSIYLIRHAQSAFNAVYDPYKPDPMIFDAPITTLGESQAQQAQTEINQLDLVNVIVSPFTRTLQTAHLIFGNKLPFQSTPRCESNSATAAMLEVRLTNLPEITLILILIIWMIAGGMTEKKTKEEFQLNPMRACRKERTCLPNFSSANGFTPQQLSLMVTSFAR